MIKFFCCVTLAFIIPAASHALKPGDAAPLAALGFDSGKDVVFLDFWASWCGPCRRSLPWIAGLEERFKERNFRVISVNLDSERSKADKLMAELKLRLPVIYDPQAKFPEQFGVEDMPTSYLIDSGGKIVAVFPGFKEQDREVIESSIAATLGEGK